MNVSFHLLGVLNGTVTYLCISGFNKLDGTVYIFIYSDKVISQVMLLLHCTDSTCSFLSM